MDSTEIIYQIFKKHPTIVTDSRKVVPGCLFFALKGERFNGNDYAAHAVDEGAACAIVDEPVELPTGSYIQVDDVLTTLQHLATHHRRQFNIPVLAITGSNGKTTTKELVSAVLSSHYPTHYTKGNLNNHIGVSLTLLAMPAKTEVAVVEMGANHLGEIDFLCRIAEPTHGLITNVGKAHLEGFGGFEGVKQTKSELYRYLAERNGLVFINMDEPYLTGLAEGNRLKLFYKKSESPDEANVPFEVRLVAEEPFVRVAFLDENGQLAVAKSQLIGRYNFNNIMTAVVIGKYFKVPAEKIVAAIESYVPSNNRSQLKTIGTNTFILDAYNANPTSMRTAINAFSKMAARHKVAILGAMKELGKYSDEEHLAVAVLASGSGFDQVVLVGEEFRRAAGATDAVFFENTAQLKDWYASKVFKETHFLIKGSRSVGLEGMLEK
ncbi:MAG: UDP-N-acetylmuramoyl-tripeptide--D-alanyl-D-alanine ligase [Saprospiraceae bacterium]|nr:UDP-N-acetylmuramoyl-tripeptide--D-alanyl-D-alanine ligase [Saprospiraceae bacterium]MCF8249053.1 UDP-N-acetylmuramoyl-tripeptide--D-alanyl-D-alanine ligase [Saprospiraceae bacterium]MCF8282724.1 UDP-N-acetylmuramoyl-tripeptide--D-alanyl-D-alanine ligase [Bacteroidales bacterium]MCF8311075.1 UDP-N-acetylmuramoyl-tripeptide--D-alanyl-D-alanine ligase [Saprospiraceae bacterium]MCF8443080.1 UDP-N-acetylmuramoyl-tripeptide--D-alanyl-D-alanine ligase [Saprospiraceae bacterium]